jgi:predicted metal-dependent phosphoesterase TrpH
MGKILEIIKYVQANWAQIAQAIAAIIGAASIIVKLTPTLKDDNILLGVIKFIGKYIALNKTVTDADRPK